MRRGGRRPYLGSMKTLAAALGLMLLPPPSDPVEVDFAVLADFDFKEGMTLPESVTRYDGKTVKVGGFMMTESGEQQGEVEAFVQNIEDEAPKTNILVAPREFNSPPLAWFGPPRFFGFRVGFTY